MIVSKLRPFSFYTKKSFGVHLLLVGIMVALSYWKWSAGEEQKKLNIQLVNSSVRVDVVEMPKLTLQELKALQKAGVTAGSVEKSEPEPVKEKPVDTTPPEKNDFIKENKEVKKKPSFADLMKKYSKTKVKEKVVKKKTPTKTQDDSGLDQKTLSKLKGLINRGNKVSEGNALVGSGSNLHLTELQEYATTVSNKVRGFWKLPSYLVERELQCRIKVFIDERGRLVRSEIFESSGEGEFDSRALKAVKEASPFPIPEQKITGRVLRGDILLGFPL